MNHLTTKDVAAILGLRRWQIARVYESGLLPEPGKFCGRRAIPSESVAAIEAVCKRKGYLPVKTPVAAD